MTGYSIFPAEWGWSEYEHGVKELARRQAATGLLTEELDGIALTEHIDRMVVWERKEILAGRLPSREQRKAKGQAFKRRFYKLVQIAETKMRGEARLERTEYGGNPREIKKVQLRANKRWARPPRIRRRIMSW